MVSFPSDTPIVEKRLFAPGLNNLIIFLGIQMVDLFRFSKIV